MVMGLGLYAYGRTGGGLYANLYCEGGAADSECKIKVSAEYPFGDAAKLEVSGGSFKLHLRNPETALIVSLKINGEAVRPQTQDGYIAIERDWNSDDIVICFDMRQNLSTVREKFRTMQTKRRLCAALWYIASNKLIMGHC